MQKACDTISEVVRIGIAPMLKTQGFKKKALNFARRRGSVVHFVNVQSSSWNSGATGSVYLNVGLVFDESDKYMDDAENSAYASPGAVLNEDDSFVDLLESPVGSAFIREPGSGQFVEDVR